tara:strand:+ start:778 stop:1170 length:393 start_codon:yes stop_codon:yes gene_type:complete
MALSIKEQLDILNGVEAPTSYTFVQYIEQVTVNSCEGFFTNTKTGVDGLSNTYISRLSGMCREILNKPNRYTTQLAKILISVYADTGSIAAVQAADDDAWVGFIENNIFNSIEVIAGVIASEKAAYDAIP